MKENLTIIEIKGKEYPIKFDNYVLCRVQEDFESIEKFEEDIVWFKDKKDKDGNLVKNKKGEVEKITKEPVIKTLNYIVPLLIEEGMQIQAEEMGTPYVPVNDKEIIRDMDIPFMKLAKIVHEEFKKCFASKKYNPR